MVRHLEGKVQRILERVNLEKGDLVIDIGSNDSTLLRAYPTGTATYVGIDPSGPKFLKYYPPHVQLIPDFFNAGLVEDRLPGRRAKIITSIAMFYDLERPKAFVADIHRVLDDEGVWVFEQSYLPFMLKTNSYDTVCHEHLEYYSLNQIKRMLDETGMKIIDVEFNDINGGSFSIMAAKSESTYPEARNLIAKTLAEEEELGLAGIDLYTAFRERVFKHRHDLKTLLATLREEGKCVLGYGASTKGNVLIQFCGLDTTDIPYIAEVNEDKFGAFTPGSGIPIISEAEAREMKPDFFLVLPWHFRKTILEKERSFMENGGKFIFPLPDIEVVGKSGTVDVFSQD